ncbi:hypothetical protein V1478_002373 [Vespula squamosa]|uniref:Ribosomal protein S18 n=1 Tax=Vespula squamosa TaxID=30214 RepID=A0ABD2BW78_VESSQ
MNKLKVRKIYSRKLKNPIIGRLSHFQKSIRFNSICKKKFQIKITSKSVRKHKRCKF